MSSFSDEVILSIRTSEVFRFGVYFINLLGLFAFFITFFTIYKLYSKQIFNPSTTCLLISDIIFINVHNISYLFLQNWSLIRSFLKTSDPHELMFDSEECWPHHVTNEYTKTTTIIIQSALVINRILVTINSQKYSKSSCGLILSVATLIVSGVVTVLQHYRGPFKGMQTTSCFRESDIVLDLRTEHLLSYIAICSVSIFCSLLLILYVKKTQNKKTYDIMSEYMRKESIISTISVTIIGTIQLISFCTYDAFLSIFAKISEKNASEHDTNVIGWFYTGPFNAIISPSAVLVYIYWIRKNRKNQIKKMTTMKDNHFQQMSVMWK